MTESGYVKNWNLREYFYFARGDIAVLKREFPVALRRTPVEF